MAADFASMIYGTAQNAAQNVGAGMPEAIHQGAQLAIQKEQLAQNQQQIQMRMQEVQQAKIDKTMDWFEKAAAMPEGQVKNTFMKNYVPNGINALGLTDVFHPDSLQMAQVDPNIIAYATDQIKNGKLQPTDLYQALAQPEKMAALAASDGFKVFGAQQKIQDTLQNSIGEIRKAADTASERAFKDKELQTRLAESKALGEARIAASGAKTSTAAENKLSTEIRSKFEPLAKEQQALASAQDARDRIMAQLAKDPSGKTASPQDLGGMIFGLLHTELGRVSLPELQSQLHLPGLMNMTKDQLIKYMGGVNPNVVKGLIDRVGSAAQDLDARKATLSDAYAPQLPDKPVAAEVLKAYQKPSFRAPPGATVQFNGHAWTREQLQQAISQSKDQALIKSATAALNGGG